MCNITQTSMREGRGIIGGVGHQRAKICSGFRNPENKTGNDYSVVEREDAKKSTDIEDAERLAGGTVLFFTYQEYPRDEKTAEYKEGVKGEATKLGSISPEPRNIKRPVTDHDARRRKKTQCI